MNAINHASQIQPPKALSPSEWRKLPRHEKNRLRAEKRERRRLARQKSGEATLAAAIPPVTPPASEPPSPFVHPITRSPLDLSFIGAAGPCFIVLAGPSARLVDLSQLSRRGIYTIAVNNAGAICRPNAWTCVDPPEKFHNGIWLDPGVMKFCPSTRLASKIRRRNASGAIEPLLLDGRHMTPADCPNVVGYLRRPNFAAERYLSEGVVNWGVSAKYHKQEAKQGRHRERILNVMFAVLKIAYSLGFRHAFLVGCDFYMDANQPYAFEQGKGDGGASSNNNAYRIMQGMFTELQPHFLAAGFHVYNTNPASGLTAFPFVGYDDAIRGATESVPQGEQLETSGWYQK